MRQIIGIIILAGLLASCGENQYKTYATVRPDSTLWELYLDKNLQTTGTGDTLVFTQDVKCVSFKLHTPGSEIHLNMVLQRGAGFNEMLLGSGDEVARDSAADSGSIAAVCR